MENNEHGNKRRELLHKTLDDSGINTNATAGRTSPVIKAMKEAQEPQQPTAQMTADQLIQAMKDMENGERIKFLRYVSDNHFGQRYTVEGSPD